MGQPPGAIRTRTICIGLVSTLESQLTAKFAMQNDHRADFREFRDSPGQFAHALV